MAVVISVGYLTVGFGLGLPLLTYLYLFWITRPRWIHAAPPPRHGEEPEPPQKVRPALAGLFFDGRFGQPELAATIIDLVMRRYLTIVEKIDKIIIIKQKSIDDLPLFERTIADHLIAKGAVAKSAKEIEQRINRKLYDEHVSEAIRSLYREGVEHGVFFEDPNTRYAWYYLVGLLIFFLGLGSFAALIPSFDEQPVYLFYPLGLILSGTTIISRARYIYAFSRSGRLIQEVWHDYRKEMVQFQPRGSGDAFIKYLPYAFAMEIEKEWAARYGKAPFASPEWFATFEAPTREEFVAKLSQVVSALARDLFAVRDPALKD